MTTVFLDTETTGLKPENCRITELAFIEGDYEFDEFIKIPKDVNYPKEIQDKTHIYPEMLDLMGKSEEFVANFLYKIMSKPDTVIVAHNAHFDMAFVRSMFARYNLKMPITCRYLDTLTVARDWLPIPHHRLENCLEFFEITDQQNSHRAIDDTKALKAVFIKMLEFLDGKIDIEKYINNFGYLSYFGKPKDVLEGVNYYPQDPKKKLQVYDKL